MPWLLPNRLRSALGRANGSPSGNGRSAAAPSERPLRAELYSVAQLERHAKSIAGWHRVEARRRGHDRLLARLKENETVFLNEYELVTAAVKGGERITSASEWFLDNYYLIEEQIRTARKHLPRGYSDELPRLSNGPVAGSPRVYDIALELISHVDGRVDIESVRAFVASYESVSPMRLGELWAIPIMLRLSLLENLRRVVLRQAASRADAERAAHWVSRMLETAAGDPSKVILVLADMVKEDRPLTNEFIAEFANRLHGQGTTLIFPMTWLEQRLAEQGRTMEHILQEASQSQAADQVSISNTINSLRFLGTLDWRDFVESMSAVEFTLRRDPAGVYANMDFATRDSYRHAVEAIARRALMTEDQVAQQAIELARQAKTPGDRTNHVGYYLVDRGRRVLEKAVGMRVPLRQRARRFAAKFALLIYAVASLLLTAIFTTVVLWWAARRGMQTLALEEFGPLVTICVSGLAIAIVQWISTIIVHPRILPRMDFAKKGIPPDHRTIVVVPTMLTNRDDADDLLEDLEVRFLSNRDPQLLFALVTDFRDAPTETMPGDADVLEYAGQGIEQLNAKYSGGFFLLHRARRFNEREGVWMGWERKRGKLEELNEFLRGTPDKFQTVVGPVERLKDVKYVITLDTDTQLPRDAARLLTGTIAHPLNRPHFNEKLGRVTEGYGVLQPLVSDHIASVNRSRFAKLLAGEPGIDPYTRAVSDVYQDLFGEGSYVGKGIYDLDAFQRALHHRLPENRILSHDLLEGSYVRAGLVSDVLLIEDFPSAYPVEVSRRHRWIRGDWQIARWLLPRVPGADGKGQRNPISILSWWKIFDNLRRSITPIALMALLLLGWFVPGGALFYTLVVIGIFFVPSLLSGLDQIARRLVDLPTFQRMKVIVLGVGHQMLQGLFLFACLPYDAYINFDAIGRTGLRLFITRRKLLEWRTARDAHRAARGDLLGFYRFMWVQPAAALAVTAILIWLNRRASPEAATVAGFWLVAPGVAWWLSQPFPPRRAKLSDDDRLFLRVLARRTWRFFETFINPGDNYLPPDNFQEDPPQGIAHRTSPTNIGLSLLANLSAYDFGYIPLNKMIDRTSLALTTLEKLQRHRGHFFNWYDTRSLEPLNPRYVSTVDSGNLSLHLLILASACQNMGEQPLFVPALFDGLGATLEAALQSAAQTSVASSIVAPLKQLREPLRAEPQALTATYVLLRQVATTATKVMSTAPMRPDGELAWWLRALVDQAQESANELSRVAPWVDLPAPAELVWRHGNLRDWVRGLDSIMTLAEVAGLELKLLAAIDGNLTPDAAAQPSLDYFNKIRGAVAAGAEHAAQRISQSAQLAQRCRELADVEYEFLYDPARRLLALGYNASEHRLDSSFYDLLASEARVASFVAIAEGKLPQEHWFSLGRQLTSIGNSYALLSWSGSMFEYLMPLLVMPTHDHTLLDETYRAVVHRQIQYGRERGVPWGISEAGYNKTDAQLNYQYRAFGVPGLGFKRGLAEDLVIAPYASVMALMVDPESSCANLRRLAPDHMGAYGFYEAIDYTADRLPPDQSSVTISSFMAHHQGMSLLSLAYLLLDQPMQRRFNADPAFRGAELLLHERVPKAPIIYPHPTEVAEAAVVAADTQPNVRVFNTPDTPTPEVHLLSNGRYHVAVTAAGGGYSRWRDLAVTRWREDAARDCWGPFCYIRDTASGEFWSTTYQPTLKRPSSYEAIYYQGRAEYRRRDGDIDTNVAIAVSPEDDIELRLITITNRGTTRRTIELTSYAEVVMAAQNADAAHPAFSNLFVQTQILRQSEAVLCTRRPRSPSERPPWMFHLMTVHGTAGGETSYETGRAEFIGRSRTVADPAAMYQPNLTNTDGSVLDPIVAIRNTVVLEPDEVARINLVTGMAETEQAATALIEKYHDQRLAERVLELAWTHSQVILQQLDTTESDTQLYGRIAGSILYASSLLRAPASVITRNRRGQSGLWGYGISGDLPIILLRIGDQSQIQLVRQLVAAHAYWRIKGLITDLILLNDDQSGYRQVLQDAIMAIISSRAQSSLLDKPGGIFVRRSEQISEDDKVLMQAVARVVITDTAGTLAEQISRRPQPAVPISRFNPIRRRKPDALVGVEVPRRDLAAFNGLGGFTPDGREYVITTSATHRTPAPWSNVLANANFGTVVTESGGAYTWCENAFAFRLTPWNNDWITDASGEAFYIRDEESGRFWSPCPQPAPGPWPYTTRHGWGYSIFEYSDGDIVSEMTTYVATDAPVKFVVLKLINQSGRPRRLSLTGYFELALGDQRSSNLAHIVTETDPKTGALLARNLYNTEFTDRVQFLDCSNTQRTVSGDRLAFLGRNGHIANPACMSRAYLSGRIGAALDPCAAMQTVIDLAAGQTTEVSFIFGSGRDLNDARTLIGRFRGVEQAHAALAGVWDYWSRTLGVVHVQTPDPSLNYLVNGWLLYQTLACRFWARTGYYQSSGAFGFRDQLQDAMAFVHAEPAILRAHLLRCAARQFRQGDVQHWWHPPSGRGVRTRISDDYLWLPYATCRYVAAIGDTGVLDEKVPFIDGRPVKPDEDSYYELPSRSDESGTLYEHCVRAIKNGLHFGERGLPLMGTGDWNDGMNLVGEHGKGESVWLAFFLYDVLMQFAPLAKSRQDNAFADQCLAEAAKLRANIEQHAWDGQWYCRAYFDNGEPLGSASNTECRIDALPQSWAILSGAGSEDRSRQGLEQLNANLVNRNLKLIKLLDPPFDKSHLNPGYIKGYIPGVRENGGQYSHAAVWAVMAFAHAGDRELAWELFDLINPIHHGDSEAAIRRYKVEPYVMAGDVYSNLQHAGRGGWTWYTGSAGWMYRMITESLLGLRLEVNRLHITPLIPEKWESFTMHYRYRQTFYHITVRALGHGKAVTRVSCDGAEQADKSIPLTDDRREHQVEIEVGGVLVVR